MNKKLRNLLIELSVSILFLVLLHLLGMGIDKVFGFEKPFWGKIFLYSVIVIFVSIFVSRYLQEKGK